ncbi:hypothetical protein GGR57DRAFT_487181 [Xylariaceae sp. FL1272]|nr:hypothetical protein GGR57DRAFT_487181 [Xylariaceae sp. FL1272]
MPSTFLGNSQGCPPPPKRRSRFGCRNCKLRKVKCDEARPQCKKCTAFGLLCNAKPGVTDMQPACADSMRASSRPQERLRLRPPPTAAIWTADSSTRYELNARCQGFITRYLARRILNPEDPHMMQANRKLLSLAFTHPHLMHASLAVALAYDRHLNGSPHHSRPTEECFHWSRATSLFNEKLKNTILSSDRDPVWGTAAALAVLTFASPDVGETPESSWPLKQAQPTDLDWVRLCRGKMSLWPIVNPLRQDSLFRVMAMTFAEMDSPLAEMGIEGMPIPLALVCGLTASCTAANNPYFDTAHALAYILNRPDNEVTTGQTEHFIRSVDGPFLSLLLSKDAVALLLLYLWYQKAGRSIWWIRLRAEVECPAIYLYLQRYHGDRHDVLDLLFGGTGIESWDAYRLPNSADKLEVIQSVS